MRDEKRSPERGSAWRAEILRSCSLSPERRLYPKTVIRVTSREAGKVYVIGWRIRNKAFFDGDSSGAGEQVLAGKGACPAPDFRDVNIL